MVFRQNSSGNICLQSGASILTPGDMPVSGWDPCSDLFHSKCWQNRGLGPSGSNPRAGWAHGGRDPGDPNRKWRSLGGDGSVLEGSRSTKWVVGKAEQLTGESKSMRACTGYLAAF